MPGRDMRSGRKKRRRRRKKREEEVVTGALAAAAKKIWKSDGVNPSKDRDRKRGAANDGYKKKTGKAEKPSAYFLSPDVLKASFSSEWKKEELEQEG